MVPKTIQFKFIFEYIVGGESGARAHISYRIANITPLNQGEVGKNDTTIHTQERQSERVCVSNGAETKTMGAGTMGHWTPYGLSSN